MKIDDKLVKINQKFQIWDDYKEDKSSRVEMAAKLYQWILKTKYRAIINSGEHKK